MKAFMDKDFLLETETAKKLFHDYAENTPVLDYHCHINPREIAEDRQFENITQVWLGGDHYKWRAMRSAGVPEECITGGASDREKFIAWANTLPGLIGNPLYHWTHLELQRYFGIREPLCGANAERVYDRCNEMLADEALSVRGIIQKSRVKLICTTDDPLSPLEEHKKIAADPAIDVAVLPAFRPDKALRADKAGFAEYIAALEALCGMKIDTVDALRDALGQRIAYFDANGCRVADHALDTCLCTVLPELALDDILRRAKRGESIDRRESEGFQTALLLACAQEYARRGWTMQLHFGCIRDNSDKMFARLGPDTGFDAANDEGGNARRLAGLLNLLEKNNALPKTILYSLNPADNIVIGTVMGCFQTDSACAGRIQMGSAWWFNDHKQGMEKQLRDLMSLGYIGSFVGMLTDSRSFLSYTRHEYFRRILCDLFGTMVENGEYPDDMPALGKLVQDISYNNARRYFGFDVVLK